MRRLMWLFTAELLSGLLLAVVACDGKSQATKTPERVVIAIPTASRTPLPTAEPTDTLPPPPTDTPRPPPTETPTPEPPAVWDAAALARPEDLDSYRSALAITWMGTTPDDALALGSMQVFVDFVRDPLTRHIRVWGDFPTEAGIGPSKDHALEIYVVGDMIYTNLLGDWLQLPAEVLPLDEYLNLAVVTSQEMLRDINEPTYRGQETYNGIQTQHFSFDRASFNVAGIPGMQTGHGSGDIYLATQGDYLVNLQLTLTGVTLDVPVENDVQTLTDGTVDILIDLSSVNEPFTIQIPEEALAARVLPLQTSDQDLLADIPVPADAEDLTTSSLGLIAFQSAQMPEALVLYYKDTMPGKGWQEVQVQQSVDSVNLWYTKAERTAHVTVTLDGETGRSAVSISIEEE